MSVANEYMTNTSGLDQCLQKRFGFNDLGVIDIESGIKWRMVHKDIGRPFGFGGQLSL